MKWQQFLALLMAAGTAAVLVWRSSGKKTGGCGCECGCKHKPEGEDAVR